MAVSKPKRDNTEQNVQEGEAAVLGHGPRLFVGSALGGMGESRNLRTDYNTAGEL